MKDPRSFSKTRDWLIYGEGKWRHVHFDICARLNAADQALAAAKAEGEALKKYRAKVATAAELLRFAFADGRRSDEERLMAREILEAIGEPAVDTQRRGGGE